MIPKLNIWGARKYILPVDRIRSFLGGSYLCLALFFCLASTSSASRLATGTPDSVIAEMLTSGSNIMGGDCSDAAVGHFVVAAIKFNADDKQGMAKAKQEAMQQIGGYLGESIESSKESSYKEKTVDGKSMSESFFSDRSAVKVNQVLSSVEMLGLRDSKGSKVAIFMLSEGAAKRVQSLSQETQKALLAKGNGPVQVEAVGIAFIRAGDTAAAKNEATDSAKRNALEAAMGASMVGLTVSQKDDSSEKFRNSVFTTTDGFISKFDVLKEGTEGDCYSIRIQAIIDPKKLVDKYGSYLQAMGDPIFFIDAAGNETLRQKATEYFLAKQFRLSEISKESKWLVQITPNFREQMNSVRPEPGVVCSLEVKLIDATTGEVFTGVSSAGNASDFMPGTPDQQKTRAVAKAFNNISEALHKQLNDTILKLAREGRPIVVYIEDNGVISSNPAAISSLQDALSIAPGIRNPKVSVAAPYLKVDVRSPMATDMAVNMIASEACRLIPDSRPIIKSSIGDRADLSIKPITDPKPAAVP